MGAATSQPGTSDASHSPDARELEAEPWKPPVYPSTKYDASPGGSSDESAADPEEEEQRIADKLSREREMELFHKELAEKRKQRQEVIAAKVNELQTLRKLVDDLTEKNAELQKENQTLRGTRECDESESTVDERLKDQNRSLMIQFADTQLSLQNANSDLLLVTEERDELRKHIDSYKDVAQFTKNLLKIRDDQLAQLKAKLSEIESSLADRELQWLSNDLKAEYEKQLQDIRNLKKLYEERAKISAREKIRMSNEIEEYKALLEAQTNKASEFEQRIEELQKEASDKQSEVRELESQLGFSRAETRSLQQELTVINQLFSQALLGSGGSSDLDMDRLVFLLEQNRDLLSEMAGTESEATSAMPRMLLDLVSQAQEKTDRPSNDSESCEDFQDEDKEEDTIGSLDNDNEIEENEIEESSLEEEPTLEDEARLPEPPKMSTAEAIVSRLPKVWRVLMELLNHQSGCPVTPDVPVAEQSEGGAPKERGSACYKSVQTPTGPRLVLSVSKTYIRLKDLILEKKSLQRELSRLKQLNSHLETRLGSQERRLGNVSSELSHTWCLAGRMQRSYRTLHSHEQILRYELQQKRKMLNGLKQELQLCREKWQRAREKNTESEVEWKRLRSEFASRKLLDQQDGCGSAESGYSDERSDDSENETRDTTKNEGPKGADRLTNTDLPAKEDVRATEEVNQNTEDPSNSRADVVSPWRLLEEGINTARTTLERERVPNHESNSENTSTADDEKPSVTELDDSTALHTSCTDEKNVEIPAITSDLPEQTTEAIQVTRSVEVDDTCHVIVDSIEGTPAEENLTNVATRLISVIPETGLSAQEVNSERTECAGVITPEITPSCSNSGRAISESATENTLPATSNVENSIEKKTVSVQDTTVQIPDSDVSNVEEEQSVRSDVISTPAPAATVPAIQVDGPSSSPVSERSPEEILSARDARLKRLEEQCKQLVNKVTRTSHRSVELCTRLEELHEQYGREDQPDAETEPSDAPPSQPDTNLNANEE